MEYAAKDVANAPDGTVLYSVWTDVPPVVEEEPETPEEPEAPTEPETPTQPEAPAQPDGGNEGGNGNGIIFGT